MKPRRDADRALRSFYGEVRQAPAPRRQSEPALESKTLWLAPVLAAVATVIVSVLFAAPDSEFTPLPPPTLFEGATAWEEHIGAPQTPIRPSDPVPAESRAWPSSRPV